MKYILLACLALMACNANPPASKGPASKIIDSLAVPDTAKTDSVRIIGVALKSIPPVPKVDSFQLYTELYLYAMDLKGQLAIARMQYASGGTEKQRKRSLAVQKEYNKIVKQLDGFKHLFK